MVDAMRPRPLLVYDGDCAFCTASVQRLERWLHRFPEAQPWQRLDLDQVGLSSADVTRYAWVLVGERRFRGHAAFAALLRMQRSRLLRVGGQLLVTAPFSWAAALGYTVIARYRHRLPGGTAACALPRT
jgi:predicted DCC family thiol-disulfide oxidoreductase YuxK